MSFEKTQPGNPHQLTIHQHVFPRASIDRFSGAKGHVLVHRKAQCDRFPVPPTAEIFCAKRAWDQRAESGYMVAVEARYQAVAGSYLQREGELTPEESQGVTSLWLLWNLRHECSLLPKDPIPLVGIPGDTTLTRDEQERAEKLGVVYVRADGGVPARMLHGDILENRLRMAEARAAGLRWTAVSFPQQSLCVPDRSRRAFVPLTPERAFVGADLRAASADELNRYAREEAAAFYFEHTDQ